MSQDVIESQGLEPNENDENQQEQEGQEPDEVSFDDLPQATKDEIRQLRREAATLRTKNKDLARRAREADQAGADAGDAIQQAEARGRKAAKAEYASQLATAQIRTALTGVVSDEGIDKVLNRLNLSTYVDDEGEVDTEAIRELREDYVALVGKRTPAKVSHGRSGNAPTDEHAEARKVARDLFTA